MGILNTTTKATTETSENKSYEKKVGFGKFYPEMINPTLEELNKVGVMLKKDIEYETTDRNGNSGIRLDIWGKDESGQYQKMTIFTYKTKKVSDSGKTLYISNNSKNTMYWENEEAGREWLEKPTKKGNPNSDWWGTSFRIAFDGELSLYRFLRLFINPDIEENADFKLDNSIFTPKGIKELKDIVAKFKGNSFYVFYTIKNNYQTIITTNDYSGSLGMPKPDSTAYTKLIQSFKESCEKRSLPFSVNLVKESEVQKVEVTTDSVFETINVDEKTPVILPVDNDLPF